MNSSPINMGNIDRLVSVIIGLGALSFGTRKLTAPRVFLATAGAGLVFRGTTGRCPAYHASGIDTSKGPSHPSEIHAAVTILKSPEEIFSLLEDRDRMSGCMKYFEVVETEPENRFRWKLTGPGPVRFSGESELSAVERPNRVEWRPAPGSKSPFTGSLEIQSAGHLLRNASIVRLKMSPDSSLLGRVAMGAYRVLDQIIFESLSRVKQLLEAGEIATVKGQSSGRRSETSGRGPALPAGLRREDSERTEEPREREIV